MPWLQGLSADARVALVSNVVLALLTVAGWLLAFMSGRWSDREGRRSAIKSEGREALLRFVDAVLSSMSQLRAMLMSAPDAAGDEITQWLLDRHHERFAEAERETRDSWADFRRNAPLIGLDAWDRVTLMLQMCMWDLSMAEHATRELAAAVAKGTVDAAVADELYEKGRLELQAFDCLFGHLRDSIEHELHWSWFSNRTRRLARTAAGSEPVLVASRHRLTRQIRGWDLKGDWPRLNGVSGEMQRALKPEPVD